MDILDDILRSVKNHCRLHSSNPTILHLSSLSAKDVAGLRRSRTGALADGTSNFGEFWLDGKQLLGMTIKIDRIGEGFTVE